jgi:hypothetical protein
MNRRERRAQEAKLRAARKEIERPGYRPANDPQVRKGIAAVVRAVEFHHDKFTSGFCLPRALVGQEVMRRCKIESHIELGSLLYRVGPDPIRDIICFCGPGNAGTSVGGAIGLYHAWLSVGSDIADFSVGDWPNFSGMEATIPGLPDLGPVQWTIPKLPQYWWRPRSELTRPWRSTGTPDLGQVWYGPFNGDLPLAHRRINELQNDIGPMIADAVAKVTANASKEFGYDDLGLGYDAPYRPDALIIQTEMNSPPAGYQRTTLFAIWRLAGLPIPDFPDAETFVTAVPTTREEAIALLQNMTLMVPPDAASKP